jgi:hypothetical protein
VIVTLSLLLFRMLGLEMFLLLLFNDIVDLAKKDNPINCHMVGWKKILPNQFGGKLYSIFIFFIES